MDKGDGDNAIYLYEGTVVATDGINDNKIIDLTFGESFEFRDKDRVASLPDEIQIIDQEDTSKYKNVLSLNNSKDFETIRETTDMNYDNINKDTKVVFWNGMMNDYKAATASQKLINNDFLNTGLINNETGNPLGVLADVVEWSTNDLKTKDVLNAYQLQQLSPETTVITHSAGNEDIYKANQVNELVEAQTPYNLISVASPRSKTDLENSASAVGANVITQINNPHDPVANGWINEDANYEVDKNPITDLFGNHPLEIYYNNGVKDEIKKVLMND